MNNLIRKDVVSILNELSEATSLDLCLAGGAVRDMLHGREIKDLDFEVLNAEWEGCIVEECNEISDTLDDAGCTDIKIFTAYEGASLSAKVLYVIKCKKSGFDVDIILRDSLPSTVQELVKLYDMSLNQLAIHKNQLVVHEDFMSQKVISTGQAITQERFDRISSKYPDYDFTLVLPFIEG